MNRIQYQQLRRQRLRLHLRAVKADRVVATAVTAALAVTAAADAAKAVQVAVVADAVKEDRVVPVAVPVAVPVDLAAESVSFFARKKSASFVSRRWT